MMPVKSTCRSFALAFLAVAAIACAARAAAPGIVLDETCPVRCYYRFAADLVSPALLKAEGEGILGKVGFDRLQRDTRASMAKSDYDGFAVFRPSAVMLKEALKVGTIEAMRKTPSDPQADWRDLVFIHMFFDPYTAPPLPADWASATFDDGSWPVGRPFQIDMPNDLPPDRTSGNMSKVHIEALQFIGTGIHAACYRARFVVSDPAAASDMTLRIVYRGGVRAMINGKEVGRGHLPAGELAADTPGDDYPAEAYQEGAERDRILGPLQVPAGLLVKGTNVLAIEIRAGNLNPIVLRRQQSRSWNALHDREGNWRHGFLAKFELRAGASAVSALRRPAGLQVWVPDIHHRVVSTEFLPSANPLGRGIVQIVGARNGTYAAQVAVGTDKDLAGLEVAVGDLKQVDGPGQLPASAVKVFGMVPFPADEFNERLGDERGLDAKFPSLAMLALFRKMQDSARPHVFDQITPKMPTAVPGRTPPSGSRCGFRRMRRRGNIAAPCRSRRRARAPSHCRWRWRCSAGACRTRGSSRRSSDARRTPTAWPSSTWRRSGPTHTSNCWRRACGTWAGSAATGSTCRSCGAPSSATRKTRWSAGCARRTAPSPSTTPCWTATWTWRSSTWACRG
jgi:hypothetical protein